MAEIVIGVGTSHSPQLSVRAGEWQVLREKDETDPRLDYKALLQKAKPGLEKELTLDKFRERDEACQTAIRTLGEALQKARPDLVVGAVSSPPATAARGSRIKITEMVTNIAAVGAKATKTLYYLSRDGVKGGGDQSLGGGRGVGELAPGASNSGTAKLSVPSTTPLDTYFVLACADDQGTEIETNESNNTLSIDVAVPATGYSTSESTIPCTSKSG